MKSITIIDRKWNAGSSWKESLSKKYKISTSGVLSNLEKGLVDLVIINMHTQKELDLNIFRRVRQMFPSIPVIAISSYRWWSQAELMRWGISHVVVKPFMMSVLEEKIEEVLFENVSAFKP